MRSSVKKKGRFVEPFSWYTGIGKPWLMIQRNPKWCHISWGDGTLDPPPSSEGGRYLEFCRYVKNSGLVTELHAFCVANKERLGPASTLLCCGVHGYFNSVLSHMK